MARIEGGNPALGNVIVFAMLMGGTTVSAAALLYPAFQALVIRWWTGGLRFGALTTRSTLRTAQVNGADMRFLWWALLFSLVLAVAALPALFFIGLISHSGTGGEIATTGIGLAGYVIAALGYSTIYRATVMLSLWQLGMESLQLSGLSALDTVQARGRASSPLGEGLADALNVGGY